MCIRPRRALFIPHLETGELFKTSEGDTERFKRAKFTALEISGVINMRLLQTFLAALTADKLPYFSITLFSQIMIIISSLSFPGILHRASLIPSS